MSIAAAILTDPKIKAIFIASLKARKVEIADEDRQIDATIRELENDGVGFQVPPRVFPKEKARGKRMAKGEPERLIAAYMKERPAIEFAHFQFKPLLGVAASTAWRVLNKLKDVGKVAHLDNGYFRWNASSLPVAGGNGKGAET